jgi:hypothetical protein
MATVQDDEVSNDRLPPPPYEVAIAQATASIGTTRCPHGFDSCTEYIIRSVCYQTTLITWTRGSREDLLAAKIKLFALDMDNAVVFHSAGTCRDYWSFAKSKWIRSSEMSYYISWSRRQVDKYSERLNKLFYDQVKSIGVFLLLVLVDANPK